MTDFISAVRWGGYEELLEDCLKQMRAELMDQ